MSGYLFLLFLQRQDIYTSDSVCTIRVGGEVDRVAGIYRFDSDLIVLL